MHRIHIKRRKWRVLFLLALFIKCVLMIGHSEIWYQLTQIILMFWALMMTTFMVNLISIIFPWRLKRLLINPACCKSLLLVIVVIHIRLWLLIKYWLLNLFLFVFGSFWFLKFTYFLTSLFILIDLWTSFYSLFFRFCFCLDFLFVIYIFELYFEIVNRM